MDIIVLIHITTLSMLPMLHKPWTATLMNRRYVHSEPEKRSRLFLQKLLQMWIHFFTMDKTTILMCCCIWVIWGTPQQTLFPWLYVPDWWMLMKWEVWATVCAVFILGGVIGEFWINIIITSEPRLERSRFHVLPPSFSVLGKSPCWVESVVERMEVCV